MIDVAAEERSVRRDAATAQARSSTRQHGGSCPSPDMFEPAPQLCAPALLHAAPCAACRDAQAASQSYFGDMNGVRETLGLVRDPDALPEAESPTDPPLERRTRGGSRARARVVKQQVHGRSCALALRPALLGP